MSSNGIPDIRLSIGSRFENIELVQVVVEESLGRTELDEDSRYWIGIAVREALANAIKHGNQRDPKKRVAVGFCVVEDVVSISIADEGEGFDPSTVGNPLEPENLLRPDGRGIFYMNRFMDEILYDFGSAGGTTVTMKKRIEPSGDDPRAVKEVEG